MRIKNHTQGSLAGTVLALLAMIGSGTATAATPQPEGLFKVGKAAPEARLPAQAIRGRSLAVEVDRNRLRKGRFFVGLPGGVSLEAVQEMRQDIDSTRYTWTGRAEGEPDSRVVMAVSGNAVAGTIAYRGKLFKLEPRADGSHILSEVDRRDPAPELDPIPVRGPDAPATPDTATTAAEGGPTLDVLVAYTPKIEAIYGASGAEALILQAVAETNQAYTNSGITARLNLVHTALTAYTESGSMSTDLVRLRGVGDGFMDELHDLRDAHGADLVTLIEDEPQYCGVAYRMSVLSSSFATDAFSVVNHACATGYYSFGHEIGHNQGAHHDPANASGAIYSYAYGHQEPFGSFRTVMAYNCPGGCVRVDHFSNPAVSYGGAPTGVPDVSDNTLTINNTASTVAGFRQQAATSPPTAPDGLSGLVLGYSTAQIEWTDTSGEESGFFVERSQDGVGFDQIASLPANAVSFQDSSLAAETSYSYRVRAWNSVGNSNYSNIATVTTEAAPDYLDQTASSDLAVAGSVTGSNQDTWADDGQSQSIGERLSGGKRNTRYGYLEHRWNFSVQPGNTVMLTADVHTNAVGDAFTFAYSTDGSNFIDMFVVDAATSGVRQFMLPPTLNGTVILRVLDNERNAGEQTAHSVQVDQLLIRSTNEAGDAPAAPEALVATATGSGSVRLDWLDLADSESGFGVERLADGDTQWQPAGMTPADANGFDDAGLEPGTLYQYRVYAFNGSGQSGFSNGASARTDEAAAGAIELSATGYKVKGSQHVDLAWQGAAASTVDVYRDGGKVATVSNSGSYTDSIGKKGGGSYAYQVCEAGTDTCSGTATVVF